MQGAPNISQCVGEAGSNPGGVVPKKNSGFPRVWVPALGKLG